MPTIITRGAGSAQGLGYASSSASVNYIEDVFSTYLYTGNGSTQTITNGIDLSGKGGLTWIKQRTGGSLQSNWLMDTVRGAGQAIRSDTTNASVNVQSDFNQVFLSSGFSFNATSGAVNGSGNTYASWTFRKQPKFFDIVTYTGNGAVTRLITHQLGSVPGAVFIKRTSGAGGWSSLNRANATQLYLWPSNAFTTAASDGLNSTSLFLTSTTFDVGANYWPGLPVSDVNDSGATYVAYLFAHNAGGFGLTGTDNVISCGSLTMGAGITTATLGYEPQWLLIKGSNNANEWWLIDNMRGLSQANYARLFANSSEAESVSSGPYILPTATGFTMDGSIFGSGNSFIYIAIRRGPMKVPTDATKVFAPKTWTGTGATANVTGIGFPSDLWITHGRNLTSQPIFDDRLRGAGTDLFPNQTTAETTQTSVTSFASMDGVTFGTDSTVNLSTYNYINWAFRRAPGFFDVVCYTGDATANRKITHNLGVAPELMIVKKRSSSTFGSWRSYVSPLGPTKSIDLNSDAAAITYSIWNDTAPTASQFTVQTNYANSSGDTFVAYLFATVAGVSKVGSYTGTGTTQTINCGFTSGARFVLIKRTDSTGDWYVWDSARGIVAGNDPYLLLNSTAAEDTSTDYVDTASSGFEISSTAPAAINANGGSFIFLAVS